MAAALSHEIRRRDATSSVHDRWRIAARLGACVTLASVVFDAAGCSGSTPPKALPEDTSTAADSSMVRVSEMQRNESALPVSPAPAMPEVAPPKPQSAAAGSVAKAAAASDAGQAATPSTASAAMNSAQDAGQRPANTAPVRSMPSELSNQTLASWGSSVCDGYSVPPGAGWPWLLGKKLDEIKGPKMLYASTPGQTTDSKESALERSKVASANFVVVCLSLGNQGLGSALTEASAQAVVDSYLDDIFTDHSDGDGDPVSMVDYIKSLNAYPIVTLVYPMADYNTMHCRHLVQANIIQQSYGIPTINHLGAANAGNAFGEGDCTWANGINAPVNVESDARHPNTLGQQEFFYAVPPDLPFALKAQIPFPVRPDTTDFITLKRADAAAIRYTPEHTIHGYTLQFDYQTDGDGTLAAVDLGMLGVITLELRDGRLDLVSDDGVHVLTSPQRVADNAWHNVALAYSYVRQKLSLYSDGALIGEPDARDGTAVRELFPRSFALGGPAESKRPAAPNSLQLRDLFINRAALHASEIAERAKSAWVGAGSLDVYAPLRTSSPTENRAQTLQLIKLQP
jgi:hypothetical protein